jgi:hypothetical protein
MKLIQRLLPIVVDLGHGFCTCPAVNPFTRDSITRADVDPVVVALDSTSYQLFTRDKLFGTSAELERASISPVTSSRLYCRGDEAPYEDYPCNHALLDYNPDVQAFIDLFVYRKRELMTKVLASSQIYFPMFEAELDKNHMPDELKYLPANSSLRSILRLYHRLELRACGR